MKMHWFRYGAALLSGATLVLLGQLVVQLSLSSTQAAAPGPKRILVPFMHMRGVGSSAGYNPQGENNIGAGSEIEMWNVDDVRSLTITEIYFTAPDGKTKYEGSKFGLPLPLELKPHTHYHFNSFYEHFTLPPHLLGKIERSQKPFVHGYLADIRWTGPTPHVRGWDLGVKDGQYYMSMPITVWVE